MTRRLPTRKILAKTGIRQYSSCNVCHGGTAHGIYLNNVKASRSYRQHVPYVHVTATVSVVTAYCVRYL